jgi:hypothetical protein
MIRITRSQNDPKAVIVGITPGFPLDNQKELWFVRTCASDIEAQLLCEMLRHKVDENMSVVRKASYFRGWKHAKAKKGGKRLLFPTAVSLLLWEKEEANV